MLVKVSVITEKSFRLYNKVTTCNDNENLDDFLHRIEDLNFLSGISILLYILFLLVVKSMFLVSNEINLVYFSEFCKLTVFWKFKFFNNIYFVFTHLFHMFFVFLTKTTLWNIFL